MTVRVMHARLVDVSRYVHACGDSICKDRIPTVTADGQWVTRQGAWESEYECADHPFLGWIPDRDLGYHFGSPSHPSRQGSGRQRLV